MLMRQLLPSLRLPVKLCSLHLWWVWDQAQKVYLKSHFTVPSEHIDPFLLSHFNCSDSDMIHFFCFHLRAGKSDFSQIFAAFTVYFGKRDGISQFSYDSATLDFWNTCSAKIFQTSGSQKIQNLWGSRNKICLKLSDFFITPIKYKTVYSSMLYSSK